jgi:hypothetical protein|tara:strand:- start:806 stop:1309 length:504 start_codon:yes stop_codon:yes gene_type:complete
MKTNLGFRSWYYFRIGYSTYFVFILAAINTLTVTYFLAIDNYPSLKEFFPSFEQYVVIIVCVGIPLLILVGYAHYKKTLAYKSETDVLIESNPYGRRDLVNSEISLQLDLKLISLILKMSNGEKIDKNEIAEVEKLSHEISKFVNERNFKNDLDIDFVKKQISKESN